MRTPAEKPVCALHNITYKKDIMKNENLVCPSPEFTTAAREIGAANPTKHANTPLTLLEIQFLGELARGRPQVPVTLKQFLGPYWPLIVAPCKFGLRVRRAVLDGAVPGLTCHTHDSGSTKLYLLDPAAVRGTCLSRAMRMRAPGRLPHRHEKVNASRIRRTD